MGSRTWRGRVHDHECTGWVVHFVAASWVVLEESGLFKVLGDFVNLHLGSRTF